jgi:chorismate mutase/prephenate dehydratase
VAYLGPEATFTHLAATSHFGYSVTYVPQPSIREIFSEVEKGACDYGVVPVENSVEGSVRHTLDLFFESDLCICAERYQPVSYDLLAQEINLSAIKTVYAHSQALNQCRNWLYQYLPGSELKECSSSAFAVDRAAKEAQVAAIAGGGTAAIFGLEAVAAKIEDFSRPPTRFLVIGKEKVRPSGRDKTSLMFALAHVPGALAGALAPITEAGINLVKIESRPTRHESWSHFFFVDLEGHFEDGSIQKAIELIQPHALYLKNLGSYPLVGDPEDPDMGIVYMGTAGWSATTVSEGIFEEFGLGDYFNQGVPGSGAALAATMVGAYEQGEPWVGYYWAPTAVLGRLDMVRLEGSEFDPADVNILVNESVLERAPDVVEFLRNYATSVDDNNEFLAVMEENEWDAEETAIWFLENKEEVWTAWVSDEVADRVKAALDS